MGLSVNAYIRKCVEVSIRETVTTAGIVDLVCLVDLVHLASEKDKKWAKINHLVERVMNKIGFRPSGLEGLPTGHTRLKRDVAA